MGATTFIGIIPARYASTRFPANRWPNSADAQ